MIDAATVIAAPAAAMILADFGADVIKVEEPGGDMLRLIKDLPDTPEEASEYLWQMDCRNKRGISLNLKTAGGMAILRRLVSGCDVFITNQPYSVREPFGLTYEDLKRLKPDMIYASLTAYGEEGPERERKGFDQLAYWARSGLMDLMRATDTRPAQGLSGMGDHPTGVALYAAIVTALLHRERTGEGAFVHTSLLANGLWSCAAIAQGVTAGGDVAQFRENRRNPRAMGRPLQCRDGRWLQFNMVRNEELWMLALTAMGATHLMADERFATMDLIRQNREALGDEMAAIIAGRTSDEWLEEFAALDVPVNRVGVVEEIPEDRQVQANRIVVPSPTLPIPLLVNHPLRVSSVAQVEPRRAPDKGEHSEEILREIGYDEAEIEAFRKGGAVT